MTAYPVIYWVVVLIVGGAVSAVLMGIGYLQGRRAAIREAADELERLNATLDRRREGWRAMTRQGEV